MFGEERFVRRQQFLSDVAVEPTQANVVLEVLQSLPRHADIARVFHERERPPILELIHPMHRGTRSVAGSTFAIAVAARSLPHPDDPTEGKSCDSMLLRDDVLARYSLGNRPHFTGHRAALVGIGE
jgi:hypothetical protein